MADVSDITKEAETLNIEDEGSDSEEEVKSNRHQRQKKQNQTAKGKSVSKKKEKELAKEKDLRESTMRAFNTYFEAIYGQERWPKLLEALQKPGRHCCLVNRFCSEEATQATISQFPALERLDYISIPAFISSERFPQPPKDEKGVCMYYPLDAASLLAVDALDLKPNHSVLDICAAPGGKTLAIMQHLTSMGSTLTSNEIAPDRKRRLKQVVWDYVPKGKERDRIIVTSRDGTHWEEEERYDRVLVDAPCSSERHLLKDMTEFLKWTPKKTGNASKEQLKILKSAIMAVRVNGLVVYGTCSISTKENDDVIEKILKKSKINIEVMRREWAIGERTKYGWIVLPDDGHGWGPLFFTILKRLPDDDDSNSEESQTESDED
ncbi:hypothetical protein PROFUN_02424 [Planoprotostelium fungivorum]|uniref:NOL1/NOP2/Sun domain family member 4 n=1 Tax=Planoprotostelium fungivorum TaxID=1890364 RepID=A0A2P6NUS6_9EUKA|nr:hypothetical protein PROFUN_02424 [Planoprotostelium fungivorum]